MRRTALLVCAVMAALVLTSVTFLGAQEDTHAATSSLVGKKVVIDPGHGGKDSGAQNLTYPSLVEKNQNLEVALKLKRLLEDPVSGGAKVYMTRTDDQYLTNTQRANKANSFKAEFPGDYVLVSIHMNGSADNRIDYTTTLYGKPHKDRALANTAFTSLSALPAAKGTGTIATRTPYQFASGVLLKSDMPAIIAESVFITSKDEGDLLYPEGGTRQDQIAQALKAGLESYFLKYPNGQP